MACVLDKEKIRKIKEIESKAYPPHMRTYEDVETPEDVEDYADCDGDTFCHVDSGWYILGCNKPKDIYVADLAADRPISFVDMNKIVAILRGLGDKIVTAECRESTSYKIIKLLEKRGTIEIMDDRFSHNWGAEAMREVEFKFKPQGFREWLEMTESMINETLEPDVKASLEKVRIFPNKEDLMRHIADMERDPTPINRGEAFRRLNDLAATRGNTPVPANPENQMDTKADRIANGHNIEKYKRMKDAKQITTPMLLTLAFFSARATNNSDLAALDVLAGELAALDQNLRDKIMFTSEKPQIVSPQGTYDFENIASFSSAIHTLVQSGVDYSKSAGTKLEFDPKIDIRPERQNDLVAEGGGIWVYRGSDPTMCRVFGKGGGAGGDSPWCVAQTSNTVHFFRYRLENGQTQYFIFDTNKSADDTARRVNPGVAPKGSYSEWVDMKNEHKDDSDGNGFGINGYQSIDQYKKYLAGKLGKSAEELDQIMVSEPVTDSERKLKKYIDDYAAAS